MIKLPLIYGNGNATICQKDSLLISESMVDLTS